MRLQYPSSSLLARKDSVRKLIVALGVALMTVACGASKKEASRPIAVPGNCPDLSKGDELAAFDFAKEYAISVDAAEKLKAAALAVMELDALADRLDADLGIACSQLAQDLGSRGDWRSGNDACSAALEAVQGARTKLGPKARTQVILRRPVCLTDVSLVTKCASICDSSALAERVRAECEKMAGRCDGNCEGVCESKGPAKCEGACSGTCEGPIKGECGGRCVGTCDGKRTSGVCHGVCIGTCERGAMNGECKGACTGTCRLERPGICAGLCSGTCSVELADVRCAGGFTAPGVRPECRARCDLAEMNHTECSTPQVGFIVSGAKDRETGDAMKVAIDKALPALVKITQEMGEKGPARVLNAQSVIEGVRKGLGEMARSGGSATAESSAAHLSKCFDEPFKKAVEAAVAVKTGIGEATALRDEASK
ncbi:MAG TPA: hypothetical protein VM925_37055 [Labilithrix sp.]|nr:hypothetical protein [Labilithrix sp.]